MKITPETLSAALPKLLADGLLMKITGHGHGFWPILYAEIKGDLFCLATDACENDRDVLRLQFDRIDAIYFEGRLESFTLLKGGVDVGVGYSMADIGEEILAPAIRKRVAEEKARPRIVPFAKEVIAGIRA